MKILILTNHQQGLYKFRKELLQRLVNDNHKVYISVPSGDYTNELNALGVRLVDNRYLNRHGTNPAQDIRLYNYYKSMLAKLSPDVVLTYTIKPNVYGGLACGEMHIPYIANITGLGTSIHDGGLMRPLILSLYRQGLKHAHTVFFQNQANCDFMLANSVVTENNISILPGSGVNTTEHCYEPYPSDNDHIIFTTIGRIMKDKGIDELLEATSIIKKLHPNTEFRLIGDFEEGYEDKIYNLDRQGVIRYLGEQKDVHSYIAESHAIIHASYHEGMSNVLLESASTGRPIIATDVPGCRETFEHNKTGISFRPRDTQSLVNAIEQFLQLSHEYKESMGRAGREKMIKEFDRNIVVRIYVKELANIIGA